jgi:hypothetical protein
MEQYEECLAEVRAFASRGTPISRMIQGNLVAIQPY